MKFNFLKQYMLLNMAHRENFHINLKPIFKSLFLLPLIGLVALPTFAQEFCSERPHYQRDNGNNLVANPNFNNNANGWSFIDITNSNSTINSLYTNTQSYDTNPGSIVIDAVNSKVAEQTFVAPSPGVYTFSWKMKAHNLCPGPIVEASVKFNGAPEELNGTGASFALSQLDDPTTTEDEGWQECTFFVKVPEGTNSVTIQFRKRIPTEGNATYSVYIDNVYFGAGRSFDSHRVCKKPFESSQVFIDALGNVEVFENGQWQPLFVFGMAGEVCSPKLDIYKNQGFNTITRLSARSQLQCVADAGLWGCFSLGTFIDDSLTDNNNNNGYANGANKQMLTNLRAISGVDSDLERIPGVQDLNDNILYYYFDLEEHDYRWWSPLANNIEAVKQLEDAIYGEVRHPQYILNGTFGIARQYNNEHLLDNDTPDNFATDYQYDYMLGDITGTYIYNPGRRGFPTDYLKVLDNLEGQRMPAVIAQINANDPSVRAKLFGAIAHGAKGMNYWKDGGDKQITEEQWFLNFKPVTEDVNDLLPLIREPHWTDWTVTQNQGCDVDFGTRNYNGKGYIIVTNYTDQEQWVTFTVNDLGYTPDKIYCVRHSMDGAEGDSGNIMNPTSNSFQVLTFLEPYGYGVYRLGASNDFATKKEQLEESTQLLSIAPNPATDFLSLVSSTDTEIEILSIDGQLVKKLSLQANTREKLDVSMLQNGVYLVKDLSTNHIEKVVIN